MPVLQDALATGGVTYLIYLRRPENSEAVDRVTPLAKAVAQNSPSFGAASVDVAQLNAAEKVLVGNTDGFDAVLLSRGLGLKRKRLASYHIDAVDDPLEMLAAWGLDR